MLERKVPGGRRSCHASGLIIFGLTLEFREIIFVIDFVFRDIVVFIALDFRDICLQFDSEFAKIHLCLQKGAYNVYLSNH